VTEYYGSTPIAPQAVGRVMATDGDADDVVTYSLLASSDIPAGVFNIDSLTGAITGVGPFDRETKDTYTLVIRATDLGGLSAQTTVIVEVIDVNDQKPVFTSVPEGLQVTEGTEPGTRVLSTADGGSYAFVAIDDDIDANGAVRYLLAADTGRNCFSIDPDTGIIFTRTAAIDREEVEFYSVTVAAVDQGQPVQVTRVTAIINIQDTNDRIPQITNGNNTVYIAEGLTGPGVVVLQTTAIDTDATEVNRAVIFEIVAAGSDVAVFDIDEFTGEVTLKSALDFEGRGSLPYSAQIIAKNTAEFALRSPVFQLFLILTDDNDNSPYFIGAPYVTVVEEGANDIAIFTVRSSDPDLLDAGKLVYAVGPEEANRFSVDAFGVVRTTATASLDREGFGGAPPVIDVPITVTDTAGHRAETMSRVTVADRNDNAPQFTQDVYSIIMQETDTLGVVGAVSATDADVAGTPFGSIAGYFIASGNTDGYFSIDFDTGVISLVRAIDAETVLRVELVITALDGGSSDNVQSSTAVVVITITDRNDNTPHFQQDTYVGTPFAEDAPVGTPVATVKAVDRDVSLLYSRVGYRIVSDPSGALQINEFSGAITIANTPIDRDIDFPEGFSVVVEAYDLADETRRSTCNVRCVVLDINDNTAVFVEDGRPVAAITVYVSEASAVGTVVYAAQVADPDIGSNGEHRFGIANDDDGKFAMDAVTGRLTLTGRLDREKKAEHTVTIRVHDLGIPRREADLVVTLVVMDINDNTPVFDNPVVQTTVLENTGDTSPVTILVNPASDKDSGVNAELVHTSVSVIAYRRDGSSLVVAADFFSVGASDGAVVTNGHIDAEQFVSFVLTMLVTDKGEKIPWTSPPLCFCPPHSHPQNNSANTREVLCSHRYHSAWLFPRTFRQPCLVKSGNSQYFCRQCQRQQPQIFFRPLSIYSRGGSGRGSCGHSYCKRYGLWRRRTT